MDRDQWIIKCILYTVLMNSPIFSIRVRLCLHPFHVADLSFFYFQQITQNLQINECVNFIMFVFDLCNCLSPICNSVNCMKVIMLNSIC